ncbi:hypothetical protein NDU88_007156 [Pleurodeles waltl]|uniref:Uncharacterized protein n=1 Tax=Pleurodeles waltl TaxID=8319 RepID=A0AAV7PKF3_PLEWA|nr:hypothetical protein NDU88_007156 [Pleurodeles waltl]
MTREGPTDRQGEALRGTFSVGSIGWKVTGRGGPVHWLCNQLRWHEEPMWGKGLWPPEQREELRCTFSIGSVGWKVTGRGGAEEKRDCGYLSSVRSLEHWD